MTGRADRRPPQPFAPKPAAGGARATAQTESPIARERVEVAGAEWRAGWAALEPTDLLDLDHPTTLMTPAPLQDPASRGGRASAPVSPRLERARLRAGDADAIWDRPEPARFRGSRPHRKRRLRRAPSGSGLAARTSCGAGSPRRLPERPRPGGRSHGSVDVSSSCRPDGPTSTRSSRHSSTAIRNCGGMMRAPSTRSSTRSERRSPRSPLATPAASPAPPASRRCRQH